MPPKIVSDVFETLGGMVKGTAKQALSDTKKMGEEAAIELGLKTGQGQGRQDADQKPGQAEEQQKKIAEAAKSRAVAKYRQILDEIKQLQIKRKREEQAYASGPAGQKAENTMVKQLEVSQQPKAKLEKSPAEAEKEKPQPLPVKQASRKTEMFRGASG